MGELGEAPKNKRQGKHTAAIPVAILLGGGEKA
jgi:hypothetical protein